MQNLLTSVPKMKNLKVIYLSAIVAVIGTALTLSGAKAAAFQSIRDAVSYDMFLPADVAKDNSTQNDTHASTPQTNDTSDSESYIGSQTIDYNREIAKYWFGISDQSQDNIINLDINASRVFVPIGNKLRIVLPEMEKQQWFIDCFNGLKLISKTKNKNYLELIFSAQEKGETQIYLDLVDKSNNLIKVIKSKSILVIIG